MTDCVAALKALTPEARMACGGALLVLPRLPFRVGRESRASNRNDTPADRRRKPDSWPNNDLYLIETGSELNVSREHFLISVEGDHFVITDQGSTCGTIVEGELIGHKGAGTRARLEDGDVIIVGTSASKFVFKFALQQT